MLNVALRRRPRATLRRTPTGWTTSRRPSRTSPPSAAGALSGVPADEIRAARARARGRRAARWPTAASASRPRSSARSASGRSTCSTSSPATSTAIGGAMFTTPAIDVVGTRPDRARPPRRLAVAGPRAAGDRRRAARLRAARGDRPRPGEGQIRAMLTLSGNPVLSTPDGARLDEALGRARLHGGRRHLRQRDHPARRRDPAADLARSSATTTTWSSTTLARAQHRPLHAGGVREGAGDAPRLADLPRRSRWRTIARAGPAASLASACAGCAAACASARPG